MASVHLTKHANLCANCEEKQSFFHENPLKWQNLHDWIEKREREEVAKVKPHSFSIDYFIYHIIAKVAFVTDELTMLNALV